MSADVDAALVMHHVEHHCDICGERFAIRAEGLDVGRLAKGLVAANLATPHEAIYRARIIAAEYARLAKDAER